MKTKSMILALAVISCSIKSQNNYKYYLEGQLCGGIFQNSPAAGMGGAFGLYLTPNSSVDLRAREIYSSRGSTIIGAISVNYRYHFNNGLFVGAGFAHHHELSSHEYIQSPADAALGSHKSITHRSGIAAELGYNFKPLAQKGFFNRVSPTTNVLVTYMVKGKGLNPLVTANIGLKIGLGKM